MARTGEMLLLDLQHFATGYARTGTLSQAPLSGSAARELLEDVGDADWAPDGASFAVVRAPGWHYRLEYPAGKLLYETTGWISFPRVSPSGDAVAFLDHTLLGDDRGSVAILDRKGTKKTLSTGWESVQGTVWSPAGDEVWFTATASGSARALYAVTLSGRQRAVAATPAGMTLQDISKDGRVLFIEQNARLRIVGLLPGETRERELSTLDWPYGPILSSDGKTLVFTEQGEAGGAGYSVYMRRLDGSPAIRLGEGEAMALSPDGKWVLAKLVTSVPSQIELLPTGAGQSKRFPKDALEHATGMFFPDGKRILFVGHEPGRPRRAFVQDLEGGAARAVTPEGVTARLLSADGKSIVIATEEKRLALLPLEGGPAKPFAGSEPGDKPLAWAEDSRSLFVGTGPREFPARVFRIDGTSGKRELWKEFSPADAAGIRFFAPEGISADGKTLVFQSGDSLSVLYVAEGMR